VSVDSSSSSSSSQQVLLLQQIPFHAPRSFVVGLPFDSDMYCNDWTDDVTDSSWWIPVPLKVAVRWQLPVVFFRDLVTAAAAAAGVPDRRVVASLACLFCIIS
jgi:hypothetical protein